MAGIFLKDLSRRMQIPATRMFTMLGVPKATAEKSWNVRNPRSVAVSRAT